MSTAPPSSPSLPPSSSPPADKILQGIGLMLVAMLAFSINDVMGKWLVAQYSVAQLLLIRSGAAMVMLSPALYRAGGRKLFLPSTPHLHALRAFCATAEVAFFYWSVVYLPLAEAVAFYLATPIFVTLLAVFFLKETVGWRRWTAILVGFIGVLIALQPKAGAALSWPSFIALAGSFFFAGANILTRRLAQSDEMTLVFWQMAAALLFGGVVSCFNWVTPSLRDFFAFCLLGIVSACAHMAINRSLKYAPAAVVVPYQYTLIVWALILGYIFFGDWPAVNVLIGALIIIGAGFYIFIREQIRAKKEKQEKTKETTSLEITPP